MKKSLFLFFIIVFLLIAFVKYNKFDIFNFSMQHKEFIIQNLPKEVLDKDYKIKAIHIDKAKGSLGPVKENEGNVIHCELEWEGVSGKWVGCWGTLSFRINLDTKRWIGYSDYVDREGQSWCIPEAHWEPLEKTEPWPANNPFSFPVREIHNGLLS